MYDDGLMRISAELERFQVLARDCDIDSETWTLIHQRRDLLLAVIDSMPPKKSMDDEHIIQIADQYRILIENCFKDSP